MRKQRIYIPNQQRYVQPKKKKYEVIEQKVELSNISGYDRTRVAKLVNLAFLLGDVMEGVAIDIESEIKKADKSLTLPLRHSIEWIRKHTRDMVSFVDNKTDSEFSEGFGETSDKIKKELFKAFEIE